LVAALAVEVEVAAAVLPAWKWVARSDVRERASTSEVRESALVREGR
jgi:hypothetical protein